jgi:hypothetical protein
VKVEEQVAVDIFSELSTLRLDEIAKQLSLNARQERAATAQPLSFRDECLRARKRRLVMRNHPLLVKPNERRAGHGQVFEGIRNRDTV